MVSGNQFYRIFIMSEVSWVIGIPPAKSSISNDGIFLETLHLGGTPMTVSSLRCRPVNSWFWVRPTDCSPESKVMWLLMPPCYFPGSRKWVVPGLRWSETESKQKARTSKRWCTPLSHVAFFLISTTLSTTSPHRGKSLVRTFWLCFHISRALLIWLWWAFRSSFVVRETQAGVAFVLTNLDAKV